MISWAAILSSTKLAHLVKVGAEAAGAGRAAEGGAVVMAEVVVVAVAEVAAVAVAGVAAVVDEIAVIVAAEAVATVAGSRLPTIKICNLTGVRVNAPRFCFPRFFSLLKSWFCSMLSLGNSYGYTIRRKRPQRALRSAP